MPQLPWSEEPITFDKADHPEHIVDAGRFPLVVIAVIETMRVTKIFMDGGSDVNLLYRNTFEKLGIGIDKLRPMRGSISEIVPGRQVMPLGIVNLKVTFGDVVNYRQEILSFEVVHFKDSYHVVMGRPCFVKFMAFPNYTYLKMKMLGCCDVITVAGNFQDAY